MKEVEDRKIGTYAIHGKVMELGKRIIVSARPDGRNRRHPIPPVVAVQLCTAIPVYIKMTDSYWLAIDITQKEIEMVEGYMTLDDI